MSVRPFRRTVLAVVALCAIVFFARCHDSGTAKTDPQLFSWSGAVAPDGIVHLRNVNGSVTVRPSRDSAVHVVVDARWTRGDPKNDIKFVVTPSTNDVTICLIWGKGNCDAENYTTGPSFLGIGKKGTDATANLTVEVPSRVRIDAVTVNGTVDIAATAPVKVVNVNGSVRVATAVGPVNALTVNGSVDVRMTTIGTDTGTVRAETVNGAAKAYLPAAPDVDYTLKVMNGGITNDFADAGAPRSKEQTGVLGKGGRPLIVKAMNGGVELHKLNADGTAATKP